MLKAQQVAEYMLNLSQPEFGDNISNLKLQKLLYYAQGFHYAMHNEPLFGDDIVAWEHGPVVEEVYHTYRGYGSNAIDIPEIKIGEYNKQQIDLMNEVYEVYGQFSAWKLRNMTHEETPWLKTKQKDVIRPELLRDFFKTLLN